MKRVSRIMLRVLMVLVLLVLIILLLIILKSPGKVSVYKDAKGLTPPRSLSEIRMLGINNSEQYLIIRSADTLNPVLLYIHGGPGSPEFMFMDHFRSTLDEDFTICYWEQRGAGKSFQPGIPAEAMSLEQFVEDAAEVTRYLISRFGKEKIFLLGHSWGSMLGSYTVQKYPDLFLAYFGIGQVADQIRAEQISYDFVLSKARELNDLKAVARLVEIGRPPYGSIEESINKIMVERKFVSRYKGAIYQGNFYREASLALLNCREYTFMDKLNFLRGMSFSLEHLWDEVLERNLFEEIPEQKLPVFIFQGIHDYQTAYPVAKEYFDSLRAPFKAFYSFEYSAHSPNFEEPGKLDSLIRGIKVRLESMPTDSITVQ